ncbi:hypothetical protein HYH03_000820 [Edaphochlamys debaryana]|nr:hypothetical protein HYH03_000820 [Edaphochlamys debaryana]|eukprot:KAG2500998.1 hypothetical protein HYH03_000820 [Edaphochlamys debaryana]
MSKLYSCRNDRLRHTHEQIWPTLKLTEPELAMFQRNSRKFVVDMGKVVTLQTKFRMNSMDPAQAAEQAKDTWTVAAKRYDASARDSTQEAKDAVAVPGVVARAAAARKVPYQQARTLLNEVQLHLDALGENPRYLRLRQLGSMHATKLQNVRKVRLLLGFQRRRFVQRMYEHALVSRGHHRMWKLVTAMESTLPVFATRLGLVDDVVAGARAVQHKKLYLNGRHPDMPYKGYLVPGDVVGPSAGSTPYFQKRIIKSLEPLEGDIMRSCIGFT